VDVGGRRKGFHAAVVDSGGLAAGPARLATPADAVTWLAPLAPCVVAVDSPCRAAPVGERSRPDERALARSVCSLRFTPEAAQLESNAYYEWVVHGLELYAALAEAGLNAVECFPTASFTRWAGARGRRSRAAWTQSALAGRLDRLPARLSQDDRDAIAAALTARDYDRGLAERFGDIVVSLA
jgi:predicted nuclease with RNAse H fold